MRPLQLYTQKLSQGRRRAKTFFDRGRNLLPRRGLRFG
jgi:hypothetical protein